MIRVRYGSLFRQPWHPSTEDLLLSLDGEIKVKMRRRTEDHLKVCWSCRTKRQRIEGLISDYMEHRKIQRASSPGISGLAVARFTSQLEQLDLESGQQPIFEKLVNSVTSGLLSSRFWLRIALGLSAAGLILAILTWLSSTPFVSAKEVLKRAQNAEIDRIRNLPSPVVYQKLHVSRLSSERGREEAEVLEIWNDAHHNRFKQRTEIGSPEAISMRSDSGKLRGRIVDELEAVFQANRMDWRKPLSSTSYQGWRESIRAQSEEVTETKLPGGESALALKTAVSGSTSPGSIVKAELIVRAQDWHPVEERLRVQGESGSQDYRVIETAFSILALDTLTPSIFADLTPPVPTLPALPLAQTLRSSPTPSAAELLTSEIETFYALHRLKACLGEPVEVVPNGTGSIEVRGLTESRERKEEIGAALEGIPLLTTKIQTVEEATVSAPLSPEDGMDSKAALEPTPSQEFSEVAVQGKRLPIQDQLETYIAKLKAVSGRQEGEGREDTSTRERIAELSTRAVSFSDSLLAEAWALRRLAERYGEWRAQNLRPATRWLVEVMLRDHLNELSAQLNGYLSLTRPMLSQAGREDQAESIPNQQEESSSPKSAKSDWVTSSLLVFSRVEQAARLTNYLFAGANLPEEPTSDTSSNLLTSLHGLDSDIENLEVEIAREFSDRHDLLTLKDRTR